MEIVLSNLNSAVQVALQIKDFQREAVKQLFCKLNVQTSTVCDEIVRLHVNLLAKGSSQSLAAHDHFSDILVEDTIFDSFLQIRTAKSSLAAKTFSRI
jgi:hypothetical protein